MDKKKRTTTLIIAGIICVVLIIGIILTNSGEPKPETVKEVMRDAVVHDSNKINFFGMEVNPSVISAFTVTGLILLFALIVRILVIPKFKKIPGKFQMALEAWVGFFDNLAKTNSPHLNKFLGAYVFAAGSYICIGTLFELFGLQVVTTERHSVALPAPIADINAAVQMGVTSYLIILSGGIISNKIKGVGLTLKEFSLPISMSFRLFGALLSGALVTELVYYYMTLSFVLPVIVGVLFTLIHAIVQTYVLTMLTSLFYGEVSEKHEKKPKEKKKKVAAAEA